MRPATYLLLLLFSPALLPVRHHLDYGDLHLQSVLSQAQVRAFSCRFRAYLLHLLPDDASCDVVFSLCDETLSLELCLRHQGDSPVPSLAWLACRDPA